MVKWASNIYVQLLSFLSIATMSGLLCSILRSVWIGKSHSNLHSSDSSARFGSLSYQFREQSKPNFIIIIIIIINIIIIIIIFIIIQIK